MNIYETDISDLKVVVPVRFGDDRGFFAECWNRRSFENLGIRQDFVQDNHSLSAVAGTIRGLHFQKPPYAQAKLVRCGRGRIFDVVVDLRASSETYGRWFGLELSFENGRQLFIPKGFAHGFLTLEPDTEVVYKASDYYAPGSEGAIRWNDELLGIDWPLEGLTPVLSDKDAHAPFFSELHTPFD